MPHITDTNWRSGVISSVPISTFEENGVSITDVFGVSFLTPEQVGALVLLEDTLLLTGDARNLLAKYKDAINSLSI